MATDNNLQSTMFIGLTITFIIFCYVTVHRETASSSSAAVTQEAREQKMALKLTITSIIVLMVRFIPVACFTVVLQYQGISEKSVQTTHIFVCSVASIGTLNLLFNPKIYSVRRR